MYKRQDQVDRLDNFSKQFGRSYQIYDDLVDVVETEQELSLIHILPQILERN